MVFPLGRSGKQRNVLSQNLVAKMMETVTVNFYNQVKRMNLPSFSQMYLAKREVPKPVAVVTNELLLLTLTEMYDWPDGDIEQAPEVSMASLP